jgi:hypothetical protein
VPSAVFWNSQLPQTVQFQLLLIFVVWPDGPIALSRGGKIAMWGSAGWLAN